MQIAFNGVQADHTVVDWYQETNKEYIMIATTQADRIAMITAIAEKRKNEAARKVRLAAVRKKTANVKIVARKKRTADDKKLADFTGSQENINHYTDASKYAKTYYGETLHETTRHDTDWGNY
jgi:hypothetical protein